MLELLLLILLGVGALLYLYVNYIYKYWVRKGVAQAPPIFGFGNIYQTLTLQKHSGLVFDEIYRLFPNHDAVGIYSCFTPKLIIRNPELIKRVTITDFSSFHDNEITLNEKYDPYATKDPFVVKGEEWKPSRSKVVSYVTPARIKEIFPLMKTIVPRLYAYINENGNNEIEAKELASLFMMDIVSDTVFGISSNCFKDLDAPFRKFGEILQKDQLQGKWKSLILIGFPTIRDLLGMKLIPDPVTRYLEDVVHQVLTYRQKNNVSRNDLFQYVLKKESGNFKELMDYGVTFFIEGFETASMVASNTIYELALNPQVQQKLYGEVKSMYHENEDPEYETLMNLPYLENVLQETQRKYPVLLYFSRICTKKCQLHIDGKSVEIETGTTMIIPAFSVHRDPSYYPDPDVFDPERFNVENKAARPPCTYIPFGEGPRICPGQKFGLIQAKLFVASIVYKYRILLSDKTPRKITLVPGALMLTPNEPLLVKLEKRE